MKRILVLSLLTCALLAACAHNQEQTARQKCPGFNPPPGQPEVTGTETQQSTVVVPPVPPEKQAPPQEAEATPTPAPPKPPHSTSAYPVAKPVPDKPGFVYSPWAEGTGLIDVRGYPPGTEVRDPWAPGKIFLVP